MKNKPCSQLNDLNSLSEVEQASRGLLLAQHLKLRRPIEHKDRRATEGGSKTDPGLFRTVKRLLLDGKDN